MNKTKHVYKFSETENLSGVANAKGWDTRHTVHIVPILFLYLGIDDLLL